MSPQQWRHRMQNWRRHLHNFSSIIAHHLCGVCRILSLTPLLFVQRQLWRFVWFRCNRMISKQNSAVIRPFFGRLVFGAHCTRNTHTHTHEIEWVATQCVGQFLIGLSPQCYASALMTWRMHFQWEFKRVCLTSSFSILNCPINIFYSPSATIFSVSVSIVVWYPSITIVRHTQYEAKQCFSMMFPVSIIIAVHSLWSSFVRIHI